MLKGLKKVFKKVGKFVKKVALPALAIGAVLLTGGAALGVLPSIGALGSSLGLSAGLTGALSTAATSATIGAVGSAVTGGNIMKGATTGLITGGVMGAAGSMLGAGGQAAKNGLGVAQSGGGAVSNLSNISAANPLSSSSVLRGMPQIPQAAESAIGSMGNGLAVSGGGGRNILGSALGFLDRNPVIAGNLIQGVGNGLMASSQAKSARKAEEREAANYGDTSQLFRLPTKQDNTAERDEEAVAPGTRRRDIPYGGAYFEFDPKSGQVRMKREA
jgi:hypothetical protein